MPIPFEYISSHLEQFNARNHCITIYYIIVAGLAGLAVWTLALASSLPELAQNDLRAVLLPSDLFVGALRGATLLRYSRARLVMALLASLAEALGLTPQPLMAPALFVAVLMAPWAMREETTRPAA